MRDYVGEREKFIAELEQLPYGEGVLVLPNRILQAEVCRKHMVACRGIDGLAMDALNFLGGHDYAKLNRQAQELIVKHVVSEHFGQLGYFQGIAGKSGFVRALTSLFTEFRRCDVGSAESLQVVFDCWQEEGGGDVPPAPVAKNRDVVLLFGAYLQYLKEHKLTDVEGFFRLAVLRLEHAAEDGRLGDFLAKFPKRVFVSDFTKLSPLRRLFLRSLARQGVEVRGDFDGSAQLTAEERESFGRVQVPVFFSRYARPEEELQGALREIQQKLAAGARAGDFLLVAGNPEDFPGVRAAAESYGVPLALPETAPLNQHPLVEEVLESLEPAGSVAEYAAQIRGRLQDLQLPAVLGTAYKEQKLDGKGLRSALAAQAGLEQVLGELERTAEFCPFVNADLPVQEFRQLLADSLGQRSLLLQAGASDGVQFSSVVGALGLCRRFVYVLGVNEGIFPASVEENWIYSDRERRCLHFDAGVELPVTAEQVAEDEYNFALLLQQAGDEIHLSWSMLTADSSAEQDGKSFYVERLLQRLPAEQAVIGDHRDLGREVGAKPISLQDALEHFEAADSETQSVLEQRYSLDVLGAWALVDRQRQGLSRYNGEIGSGYAGGETLCLSASALTDYAKCPFSYLAKRVWRQEPEEQDEDLPAYEAGNLLHSVVAGFYGKFQQRYATAEQPYPKIGDAGVDLAECEQLLQEALAEQEKIFLERYAGRGESLQLQIRSCRSYVDHWWRFELKEQREAEHVRPMFFERKFCNYEPVTGLQPRVVFRGAVDRIDGIFDAEGHVLGYYVSDYKTGSLPNGATNFQVPLYVTELYGDDVCGLKPCGGSYVDIRKEKRGMFSPSGTKLSKGKKSAFNNLPAAPDCLDGKTKDLRDDSRRRIREVLEQILAGRFAVKGQYDRNSCGYCAFRTVCRVCSKDGGADE